MILTPSTIRKIQLYISNALIYVLALLLFRYGPYYPTFLNPLTQLTLVILLTLYLFLAPLYYYFCTTAESTNKSFLFLRALCHWVRFSNHTITLAKWKSEEKVAGLFLLVKLFYVPVMTNFFVGHLGEVRLFAANPGAIPGYVWILTLIFGLDTLIFAVGYLFEFPFLHNVVKSVEPTLLGWIVTLICYPPFNSVVGTFIPWGANEYSVFASPQLTLILHIMVVFLLGIYLSASIALGFKASNLTNRGIVTTFPYSVIRHPAYVSKITVWWITMLPVLNFYFVLGMLLWTLIYYTRAVTEERHLSKDPEYTKYCEKVRYRFIPRIW